MYVFMLKGPNENRQCAGVHELNPFHQAEVGAVSPTEAISHLYLDVLRLMPPRFIFSLFSNRIFNVLCATHL